MLEVDDGPSRRVSRGRKRPSNEMKRNNFGQTGRQLRSSRYSGEADLFSSCIQANPDDISQPDKLLPKCLSSSTPKAKRSRNLSVDTENLNTSDALFADLDIDTITSQALSHSQTMGQALSHSQTMGQALSHSQTMGQALSESQTMGQALSQSQTLVPGLSKWHANIQTLPQLHTRIPGLSQSLTANPLRYTCKMKSMDSTDKLMQNGLNERKFNEKKIFNNNQLTRTNVSSLSSGNIEYESQYVASKFGNYHPTQILVRKEDLVDNRVTSSQCNADSSFSFSFIGNDTQVEENSVTLNSIKNKQNKVLLTVSNVGPKDIVSKDDMLQTQPGHNQVNIDKHGLRKFRCTPYFKTDVSISVVNNQPHSQFSVTGSMQSRELVPTLDTTQSQILVPTLDTTQSQILVPTLDTTQSQVLVPTLDTTQLKDGEGFKYRCTPYKAKSKDMGSQSQTHGELIAGTQYHSYLHESRKSSQSQVPLMSSMYSKQSQFCNVSSGEEISSQFHGTEIPCTGICDMTGVIVDSQNNADEAVANTSGCDMFNDTFCDNNTQAKACGTSTQGKMKGTQNAMEISSHTQNLHCVTVSEMARKHSLDDDLECIMQESQNRRNKSRLGYEKSMLNGFTDSKHQSTLEDLGNKVLTCHAEVVENVSVASCVQENAYSFYDETKLEIQPPDKVQLGIQSEVGLVPNLPTTPGGASSLQDRIKKRLMENVGRRMPQGPGFLMEQLREQVLERVHLDAELKTEQLNNDIGPFYGLPKQVKHLFENYRGIKSLYDWQDECLKLPAVLERRNLIYSLPTSGGKTLVAEILILQELLCNKRDALLILPFVSIVQEKVRNMSQFAIDLNFHVEEYAGSKGRFPPIKRRNNRSLYIATIEKAQSIVNSLIETDRMDNLGLVVVDELHMLGEGGSRGSTLESTLMKILHAPSATQIIGMSATLNNIDDLRQFLNAEVYSNDFRPVTLTEHVKLTESIYRVDQKAKCPDDQFIHDRIVCFQYPPDMARTDPDHILGLALEVIPDNSCLVFCPTKKNCENVALMLCKLMAKYKRELSSVKRKERRELLKELHNDSEGHMCPVLQYTIHFGVAYHHSGLTVDERKLIEEAYSEGKLCLLACTSTLAAGVNLPAKRVILRSPYVGQYFISRSQYKQMVGRAGRAGIDSTGESVLICKSSDRDKVRDLLAGPLESCHSSLLYNEGKGIRTLLLSTIGLKITTTTEDVFKFVSRSLAQCQQIALGADVRAVCRDSLQKLIDSGLVIQLKTQAEDPQQLVCHSLEVTNLGKATFKGPIDPDCAEMLYRDLKKAKEPLVISNHLHLLYLVTPYDVARDLAPSWYIYFNQMSHFDSSELKVASLIGVPESYIARRASQQKSRVKVDDFVVSRFYLTLMLYDLWREKSVWEVAEKFQQPRGFIQNLLSSAASFASCVTHFCQELDEFWAYQDLMGNFVKRLSYCVSSELIPIVEIPGVKLGRARLMYTAGYKTLSSVASAVPEDLVKAVQYMPRKVAAQIVASAKLLLSEKAEAILEEVEALVTVPSGDGVARMTNTTPTPIATPAPITPHLSQSSVSSDH